VAPPSTDGITQQLSSTTDINSIPTDRSSKRLPSSIVPVGQQASLLHDRGSSRPVSPPAAAIASETLSVSREEVLKGVIIKGILSMPAGGRGKGSTASGGSNPFEKRTAPAPPSLHKSHSSESEPKTKSKNRNR